MLERAVGPVLRELSKETDLDPKQRYKKFRERMDSGNVNFHSLRRKTDISKRFPVNEIIRFKSEESSKIITYRGITIDKNVTYSINGAEKYVLESYTLYNCKFDLKELSDFLIIYLGLTKKMESDIILGICEFTNEYELVIHIDYQIVSNRNNPTYSKVQKVSFEVRELQPEDVPQNTTIPEFDNLPVPKIDFPSPKIHSFNQTPAFSGSLNSPKV